MIWFTADLHFGHKKILSFCPDRGIEMPDKILHRIPFKTVEEMDECYIHVWNRHIKPQDTVYVLGDFALTSAEYTKAILKRLKGHKILVPGNHDTRKIGWYKRAGFHEVIDTSKDGHYIYVNLPECPWLLMASHYPYRPSIWKQIWYHIADRKMLRYMKRLKPFRSDTILLHGHVHNRWRINRNMINVGIDIWERPINEEEICRIIEKARLTYWS